MLYILPILSPSVSFVLLDSFASIFCLYESQNPILCPQVGNAARLLLCAATWGLGKPRKAWRELWLAEGACGSESEPNYLGDSIHPSGG